MSIKSQFLNISDIGNNADDLYLSKNETSLKPSSYHRVKGDVKKMQSRLEQEKGSIKSILNLENNKNDMVETQIPFKKSKSLRKPDNNESQFKIKVKTKIGLLNQ